MKHKIHEIKLADNFLDDVNEGRKRFEIRFNDRGYQRGDLVMFRPVNGWTEHPVYKRTYQIEYVLNGWGLENGYVVFGFEECK